MAIISETLVQELCCNGRVRLQTWERTPLKIYWSDSQGNNSGEFDTSQYPIEQHPFTWATHSQPRLGYKPYSAYIQTAFGSQNYTTPLPPLGTQSKAVNPSVCSRISKVRMNGILAYYEFDEYTFNWTRPVGVNAAGGRGGSFIVTYYDSEGNSLDSTIFSGNAARGLYQVKITPYQDEQSLQTCTNRTFCTLEIYDAQNAIVKTVTFANGVGCPNVWSYGCTSADTPITNYWELESYYYFSATGGVSTRTQYFDCILIYGVTDEEGANGLKIVLRRYFSLETIYPLIGQVVIDLNEWYEDAVVGYRWSPIGCPAPAYTLDCDPEPPEDPRCPDGTAYECVRSDGKTCCYDCEGNVIAVIG